MVQVVPEVDAVNMIKDLQKLVGIEETDDSALKIWRSLSEESQKNTCDAHEFLFK
jgi:hypothetical protein